MRERFVLPGEKRKNSNPPSAVTGNSTAPHMLNTDGSISLPGESSGAMASVVRNAASLPGNDDLAAHPCGITEGDMLEQQAILYSLAATHHGSIVDISSPSPVKKLKACGGDLSSQDAEEVALIFHRTVAAHHGECVDVTDNESADLD